MIQDRVQERGVTEKIVFIILEWQSVLEKQKRVDRRSEGFTLPGFRGQCYNLERLATGLGIHLRGDRGSRGPHGLLPRMMVTPEKMCGDVENILGETEHSRRNIVGETARAENGVLGFHVSHWRGKGRITIMPWQLVAESSRLPEGEALEVVVGQDVVAIFRHENQLYAIDGMCAHQGGPLAKGHVANGCVTCPWHGWQYELRNGFNAVTCRPMLRTFEVREEGGLIEVHFP